MECYNHEWVYDGEKKNRICKNCGKMEPCSSEYQQTVEKFNTTQQIND